MSRRYPKTLCYPDLTGFSCVPPPGRAMQPEIALSAPNHFLAPLTMERTDLPIASFKGCAWRAVEIYVDLIEVCD